MNGLFSIRMNGYRRRMLRSHGNRRLVVTLLLAASLSLVSSLPASAQSTQNQDTRPYDTKLFRLSEILGAVHYLRGLCGSNEGQLWRQQMQQLLDAEGTSAIRRVRLVKNFNKGYRSFRRTYRNCTQPATVVLDRFITEGATLADRLVNENK
ncbi:MAG: TIGR02301 family protein [Methyloligellaceae bacterium]